MIPLERIRQRKLFQWAAAYLAGAWLVLQVTDVIGEQFAWPSALLRSITALLAVGFFAALVIAWYHGEKGQQRVSGIELLMLAGILVVAGTLVSLVSRGTAGNAAASEEPLAADVSTTADAPAERSIAVLPFGNLSRDPDNEYFSDGITDEILTTLANVGDLRVISRTSMLQYKGSNKPLRQIASELGVAHVLEGSVQRAGDRVRITAQLIDARTDAHLWAERYDRPLEDIFAVQSEIAQQIAQALQAKLTEGERTRLERQPTTSTLAHDYVLRAKEYLQLPNLSSTTAALALLRKARELDPSYPDVHATLSRAFRYRRDMGGGGALVDSGLVAARRAIALDSEFAPGYAHLGWLLDDLGERDAALEAHLRAVQLNPNLSDGLANHYVAYGRLDEAARWWRSALQGDPRNSVNHWLAGRTYLFMGMTDQARTLFEKSLQLAPNFVWSYYSLAHASLLEGDREGAKAQIQRMLDFSGDFPQAWLFAGLTAFEMQDVPAARRYLERYFKESGDQSASSWRVSGKLALAWILHQSGEAEQARRLVTQTSRQSSDYITLAKLRMLEGDQEGGLRELESAVRSGWRLYTNIQNDPILHPLRGDARFERLMQEVRADVARMRARVDREGW